MFNRLKGLMVENNITQLQMAQIIDLNPSTLNFKLNGKSEFTLSEAMKISSIFNNKSIEEIFLKS